MNKWYDNPERDRWQWYYRQELSSRPKPSLKADRWRCLLDACEVLYVARVPIIRPFVTTRADAFLVSAALVWHGFGLCGNDPAPARGDPIPVYYRACHTHRTIETDEQLKRFLRDAWNEAFLRWLPTCPKPRS